MAYKTIAVPGHGDIDFPDTMSDDDIAKAISEDILKGAPAVPEPAAETPAPAEEKPGILRRISNAVKPKAEAPKDLESRLAEQADPTNKPAGSTAVAAAMAGIPDPTQPRRMVRQAMPVFPKREVEPMASRTAVTPTAVDAAAAPTPTPAAPATASELQQENEKRKTLSETVIEKEFKNAVKAGFTKEKYGTHEAAVRAYLDAIERPAPKPLTSTAELDAERGRKGADLSTWNELEQDVRGDAAKKAADHAASPEGIGEEYKRVQDERGAAITKAIVEHGADAIKAGFSSDPAGIRQYMKSIGQDLKQPYLSPEQYAEERAGISRGQGQAGKVMAGVGDLYSGLAGATGWQAISNALTGRSAAERAGERIQVTDAALKSREAVKAIEAKPEAERTPLEKRQLEESGFFAQLGQLAETVKDHPGEVGETLLVDFIEKGPAYIVGSLAAGKAVEGIMESIKDVNNVRRLQAAIDAGQSAAKAEVTAQRVARTEQALVKPSMLKRVGIEVAHDLPGDVAVGMIMGKQSGQDYKAGDLMADIAFSGIINVPLGITRALREAKPLTAAEFKDLQKAVEVAGIEDHPAVLELLPQLKAAANDERFVSEGGRIRLKAGEKTITRAEAEARGYDPAFLDKLGIQDVADVAGETKGRRITLYGSADAGTLAEELTHVKQDVLRTAAPGTPEAAVQARIKTWVDQVRAANAALPEGRKATLPQGREGDAASQAAADVELFAKAYVDKLAGESSPWIVPDDLANAFDAVFGGKEVPAAAAEATPGAAPAAAETPAPAAAPTPEPERPVLNAQGELLLKNLDATPGPVILSNRLRKIAEANGIETEGLGAPEIVASLRARSKAAAPAAAAPAGSVASPEVAAGLRRPLRPGEVSEPIETPAADAAAEALRRRMPVAQPVEPESPATKLGRMSRKDLPQYQLKGFKSKARETIEKKMPKSMLAKDARGLLAGLSQDELKWMGIDDYLEGKERIDKADLLRHIDENAVDVQEVVKGEGVASKEMTNWLKESRQRMPQDLDEWKDLQEDLADRKLRAANRGDIEFSDRMHDLAVEAGKLADRRGGAQTKFDEPNLVTPGGENYRELLLRTPSRYKETGKYALKGDDGIRRPIDAKTFSEALESAGGDPTKVIRLGDGKPDDNFTAGHYEEPNVLAHVRFNDRTTPDGKKILFLEEIQSDWHQQGRKRGYRTEAPSGDFPPGWKVVPEEYKEQGFKTWGIVNDQGYNEIDYMPEDVKTEEQAREWARNWYRERSARSTEGGVPDGPFKKTWHELALRRMMQYAAENGYDGVAWLPGVDQAKRYKLSNQVDQIVIPMVNDDGSRSVRIDLKSGRESVKLMVAKDGKVDPAFATAGNNQFAGKTIDEVVGKDVAEKVMSAEAGAVLSADDLSVGGEGMTGFYDKIVPNYLNKLGKKWGANVDETEVGIGVGDDGDVRISEFSDGTYQVEQGSNEWTFETLPEARAKQAELKGGTKTVPFIPVTDAMRTSIKEEGLPLFQLRAKNRGPETERQDAVRAAVIAKTEGMKAAVAKMKADGFSPAAIEATVKRSRQLIRDQAALGSWEAALARDVLKNEIQKPPSETIKQTIRRMTDTRMEGEETLTPQTALRQQLRTADVQGKLKEANSELRQRRKGDVKPETVKQRIIRSTNGGITGTEAVKAKDALRMLIRQLDLQGQVKVTREAMREGQKVRRFLAAVAKRMPDGEQKHILTQVATAKDAKSLSEALAKVADIMAEYERKGVIADLREVLKTDAGKMLPEFRDAFTDIANDLDRTRMSEDSRGKMEKFAAWIEKQQAADAKAEADNADEAFVGKIEQIPAHVLDRLKRLDKTPITDMTVEDARDVLNALEHVIFKNEEKTYAINKREAVKHSLRVSQALREIKEHGPDELKETDTEIKPRSRLKRVLDDGSSPEYIMAMIGGRDGVVHNIGYKKLAAAMSSAYQLREGSRRVLMDFFEQQGKSENDLIDWRNDKVTVKLESGKDLTLTRPQLVSLYATAANDDSRALMLKNGITQEGKIGTGKSMEITALDLKRAQKAMTEFDVKTAETILAIFDVLKDKLNEASVVLDGYEKFTVPNYFPRVTDKSERNSDLTNIADFFRGKATLENAGFTKAREKHGDPLVIADAMAIFDRHINDAAMYSEFAAPARDALRLFGDSEIKKEVTKRFGDSFTKDMRDYIIDVSGMSKRKMTEPEKAMREVLRAAAVGILGYRPTTIVNNLLGAPLQMMAEMEPKQSAAFLKNWTTLTPAESKRLFEEMSAFDGYFEHRYGRDPYRLAVFGGRDVVQSVGNSKAYAALKKVQDHSMKWMQDVEQRAAVAYYKTVRDGISDADAQKALKEVYGEDAGTNAKMEYAAKEAMIMTRRTQNSIDDLDKSVFARRISQQPAAQAMYMFTSQLYKLRDMARFAILDYERDGDVGRLSTRLAYIGVSAALVPTVVSEAWRSFKGGFREKDEREEAKRLGPAFALGFNLIETADPRLGAWARALASGSLGVEAGGRGGASLVEEGVGNLAKTIKKLVEKKPEKAWKPFLNFMSTTGVPAAAPLNVAEGIFKMVTDGDPALSLYNERYLIQKKFGVDEKGKRKDWKKALLDKEITGEEAARYRILSKRIDAINKVKTSALSDTKKNEVIEGMTK